MNFGQAPGTNLESLSLKAGGEALTEARPTILSCGGVHVTHNHLPNQPLLWLDILKMPGMDMANRLFGLAPVAYEWNPYAEESVYEN